MNIKKQKLVLVTGASSGIGKALIIELLKQECEVIGISSSKERLNLLEQ